MPGLLGGDNMDTSPRPADDGGTDQATLRLADPLVSLLGHLSFCHEVNGRVAGETIPAGRSQPGDVRSEQPLRPLAARGFRGGHLLTVGGERTREHLLLGGRTPGGQETTCEWFVQITLPLFVA